MSPEARASLRALQEETERDRAVLESGIGDLVLQTISPESPRFVDPAYRLMRTTALELKAIALATHTEVCASFPSDDDLTLEDVVVLLTAIGTRLEASAALCQRLAEARWPKGGPWLKTTAEDNDDDNAEPEGDQ